MFYKKTLFNSYTANIDANEMNSLFILFWIFSIFCHKNNLKSIITFLQYLPKRCIYFPFLWIPTFFVGIHTWIRGIGSYICSIYWDHKMTEIKCINLLINRNWNINFDQHCLILADSSICNQFFTKSHKNYINL